MGAVFGQVINGEIRPVALGNPEEPARQVHLQILMRVQRRGSVVQVRGRPWIRGVRDIDHHDAGVLLQRVIFRCHVGAVIKERRSVLRKGSLSSELADELQVAVVAALGVAAQAFPRRGLALQSAFGPIERTTMGFGHRSHPWDLGCTGRQRAAAECENRQTDRGECCAQYAPLRNA